MSDLISRSELLEELKSLKIVLNGKQIFSDDAKDTVLRIVNEQPTAYDIDEVVEELEKIKGMACDGKKCSECEYTSDCFEGEQSEKVAIDKAIEIVKQVGVSDDVCEWKSASDGEFIQNPHTKRLYSNEPSMKNIYCNCCGKKIKVVE